jgi:hypothetical protein
MTTIKKLISILFIVCFFNCKSITQKKDSYDEQSKRECFKLENQQNINSIYNLYDNNVKENYLKFLNSDNEIDMILVVTTYGASINQDFFRIYEKDNKSFMSNKLKTIELKEDKLKELLSFYTFENQQGLYVNCPNFSSKAIKSEFLFKKDKNIVFAFNSNSKIENIDVELAKKEINFLNKFNIIFGNVSN